MFVDPAEVLMKTTAVLVPTATSSVGPIPTIIPDIPEYQKITAAGARTLWVTFAIMLIASVVFTGLSWNVQISRRFFHVITTLITIIGSLLYLAMATGHGTAWRHIVVRHSHDLAPDTPHHVFRQVFWIRYLNWFLTFPLLLLDLGFLAGLSGAHLLMAVSANLVFTVTGFFSTFGHEHPPQKWGWFVIACLAYLIMLWHLVVNGRPRALARGNKVGKFFTAIAGYSVLVWTAYIVVWGVARGRHLTVNGEVIAYAILDILATVVFGSWLLFTQAREPDTNVELDGVWAYGSSNEGRLRIGGDDGA